jgi:hypothetical protein
MSTNKVEMAIFLYVFGGFVVVILNWQQRDEVYCGFMDKTKLYEKQIEWLAQHKYIAFNH